MEKRSESFFYVRKISFPYNKKYPDLKFWKLEYSKLNLQDEITHIVYHHGYLPKTPFENIFNMGVMFIEASSIKFNNSDALISSKSF